MTATLLTPPDEMIHLSGISWQTYETLLEELRDRRLRLTYNRGNLEIMAPSPEHERFKKVSGRFVETLAEELEIRIEPLGSTTFKHPELSGAEPDECFYIYNIGNYSGCGMRGWGLPENKAISAFKILRSCLRKVDR